MPYATTPEAGFRPRFPKTPRDLGVMVTHRFSLDDIVAAYDLFANQRDGVLKVAIKPA